MKVKINISTEGNKLIIQDLTKYLCADLKPHVDTAHKYYKEDVYSVILLESHKSNDIEGTVSKYAFGDTILIDSDGWYTVHYIIIPTKEWLENHIDVLSNYGKVIYYSDGKKIYNYYDNYIVEDLREIVDNVHYSENITTSAKCATQEWISFTNLYECYINLCQLLLQNRGFSSCNNKNKIDSELIYKRDLVWMTINVINYLIDRHSENNPTLGEAQRLLEILHSCNGICPENESNTNSNYGCGCSQR